MSGLVAGLLLLWLFRAVGKKRPPSPRPSAGGHAGVFRTYFYVGFWWTFAILLRSPILSLSDRLASGGQPVLSVAVPVLLGLTVLLLLGYGPQWLVFRVLRRLDGGAARCVLFLWPHGSRRDRETSRVVLRALLGLPLTWSKRPRPRPLPAESWTACAAAIQAEVRGDAPGPSGS